MKQIKFLMQKYEQWMTVWNNRLRSICHKFSGLILTSLISIFGICYLLLLLFIQKENIHAVVIFVNVISIVYFFSFFLLHKISIKKQSLYYIFLFGFLFRLLFFFTKPEILSDDVYRFYWDGKVQTYGINPYLYPPQSPELNLVPRDDFYLKINHRQYPTIYPPLSQFFFFICYSISQNSLYSLKTLYLLFDILLIIFLFFLTKNKINQTQLLSIYILFPLIIIETYIGMHLDIIGASLLLLSLYFIRLNKFYLSIFFLTSSILTKYISLIILPIYFIYFFQYQYKNKKPFWKIILSVSGLIFYTILLFMVFYLPYISAGSKIFNQFLYYNQYWQYNASLLPILQFIFPTSAIYAKSILIMVICFIIYLSRISLIRKMRMALLIFLLFNGVLYPWYLIWILPLFILKPKLSDLYLISIIPLCYLGLIQYKTAGIWQDTKYIKLIEYIPFYLLFFKEIFTCFHLNGIKKQN